MTPLLIPAALIAASALLAVAGVWLKALRRWLGPALAVLAAAALAVELWQGAAIGTLAPGGFHQDRFSLFAQAAVIAGWLATALLARRSFEGAPWLAVGLLLATLGALTAASAAALVALWLGLLLVGVGEIASRPRAPGWWLSGGGLVFSGAGLAAVGLLDRSWSIGEGYRALPTGSNGWLVGGAVALLLLGLVAIALSVLRSRPVLLPLAGTACLLVALRVSSAAAAAYSVWAPLLTVVAAAGVVGAGLVALSRTSAQSTGRRLAVLQSFWIVGGLATHDQAGAAAVLLTLAALLVAWTAVEVVVSEETGDLRHLFVTSPARGALLALSLASLAGLPPLIGFFGDFTITAELFRSGLAWLAMLDLFAWVLAMLVVLRILTASYLAGDPEERITRHHGWRLAPLLVVALLLGLTVFANPIQSLAAQGATALGLR